MKISHSKFTHFILGKSKSKLKLKIDAYADITYWKKLFGLLLLCKSWQFYSLFTIYDKIENNKSHEN